MPTEAQARIEDARQISQVVLEQEAQPAMPEISVGTDALPPSIDAEKFAAVSQHVGSPKEMLQQFKDNPNAPLPTCVRNLGITSVDTLIKRMEGTDNLADRALTIQELREARKKETEEQHATAAPEKEKPPKTTNARAPTSAAKQTKPAIASKVDEIIPSQEEHKLTIKASPPIRTSKRTPDIAAAKPRIIAMKEVRPKTVEMRPDRVKYREIPDFVAQQGLAVTASLAGSEHTKQVVASNPQVAGNRHKSMTTNIIGDEDPMQVQQQLSTTDETNTLKDQIPRVEDFAEKVVVHQDGFAIEHGEEVTPNEVFEETAVIGGVEFGTELSIPEIEDTQPVETAFIGELILGALVDLVDLDTVDGQADLVAPQLHKPVMVNSPETYVSEAKTFVSGRFEEQLDQYLQSLEPSRAEAVKPILDNVMQAAQEARKLPETDSQGLALIEQQLEQLCTLLFECLEIDFSNETVKQFIQSITTHEPIVILNKESLPIEDLNSMGTSEYKVDSNLSLLGGLAQITKQNIHPNLLLGRYALLVSVE